VVELSLPEEGLVSKGPDRLIVKTPHGMATALAVRRGDEVLVSFQGKQYSIQPVRHGAAAEGPAQSGEVRASMPSQVVEVLVDAGDSVMKGQKLVVIEAMKMQLSLVAPFDGTVDKVEAVKGSQAKEGQLLVHIQPHGE
jgi:3-methylcrotonyl-CoA carboxylase alpha subunit